MQRSILKGTLVVLATGTLVTGALVSPALADDDTDGHGGHGGHDRQTVEVVGSGTAVAIDDHSIRAGKVSFDVSSTNKVDEQGNGGSAITLFKLTDGTSQADFFAALVEEFNQEDPLVAAKGTRDLTAAATYYGLADVVPDYPEVVTEFLDRGTYYLMDLTGVDPTVAPPALTRLRVRGHDDSDGNLRADVAVKTVDETFVAPRNWPAKGTYTFTNKADTIHFMEMVPVKDGTTDEAIQAFFTTPPDPAAPDAPPPFFKAGPSGGNDVVSPGKTIKVRYALPAGTYVLLCFVADEEDGTPHAIMGMHKVVVLK